MRTRTVARGGTTTRYTSIGSSNRSSEPTSVVGAPLKMALARAPSTRPFTNSRSSLGSSGSAAGAAWGSAPGGWRTPNPVEACQPGLPTSRAPRRTTCAAWYGVSSGRAARTQATAAETIGAENDVPDTSAKPSGLPSGSKAVGTPARTSSPGALRSTAELWLEKYVARSSAPVAATVSTWGRLAGDSGGLPSPNSFPAAATGTTPLAMARWIASYPARRAALELELMLTTAAPAATASEICRAESAQEISV